MSAYLNSWKPSIPERVESQHLLSLSPSEYDQNFCFPKAVRELENDRVKLVPFVPSLHAEVFYGEVFGHHELFKYLPIGPFTDVEAVVTIFEKYRRNSAVIVYAVFDKTRRTTDTRLPLNDLIPSGDRDGVAIPGASGRMAGVIGFLNANPEALSVEIGWLLTFPPFQRTHLASNAIGILVLYALASENETAGSRQNVAPSSGVEPWNLGNGGLGMRRVFYQTSPQNQVSVKTAERFGFKLEGIARWQRVLPDGYEGVRRAGDPVDTLGGMHSAIMALTWEDWRKDTILGAMKRQN